MSDFLLREAIRAITAPVPSARTLRDKILAELEKRGITDDA